MVCLTCRVAVMAFAQTKIIVKQIRTSFSASGVVQLLQLTNIYLLKKQIHNISDLLLSQVGVY